MTFLYHATYAAHLKSIKKHGLGGSQKPSKNWEDSKNGVVYLAIDKDVAFSYAESCDMVNEDWLDEIVILEIDAKFFTDKQLSIDKNVIDNDGETLEFHGIIPWEFIRIV